MVGSFRLPLLPFQETPRAIPMAKTCAEAKVKVGSWTDGKAFAGMDLLLTGNPTLYPPGNEFISHLGKLGKSQTQKCLENKGDMIGTRRVFLFHMIVTSLEKLQWTGNIWKSHHFVFFRDGEAGGFFGGCF